MSFYTSLSGLKNAQTELNTVAHNIANSETAGFKKSRVDFADIVATSAYSKNSTGIGSTVETTTQNFTIGPIEQTGSALDLAITGDGFFEIKTPVSGDTMYTRNGAFTIDQDGFISDASGNQLQFFAPGADPATAAPGATAIPATNTAGAAFAGITVAANGEIKASYADGSNVDIGTVALARFPSTSGLKQVGSSNWEATGLSGTATYGQPDNGAYGGLLAGALERSNVDIAEELVSLITAQRYFQANAKAIDTATQITQTVINLRT